MQVAGARRYRPLGLMYDGDDDFVFLTGAY